MQNDEIKNIDTAIIEVKRIVSKDTIDIAFQSVNISNEKIQVSSIRQTQMQSKQKSPRQKGSPKQVKTPKSPKLTEQKVIQPRPKLNTVNRVPANLVSLSEAPLIDSTQIQNTIRFQDVNRPKFERPKPTKQIEQKTPNQQSQQNKVKGPNQNNKPQIKKSASAMSSMNNQQISYEKYWDMNLIEERLANKSLIQGKLRINQRSYEDAFVTDSNGGSDIYISGLQDRNRALNNDIVALKLKEKFSWNIPENNKNRIIAVIKEFELENKNSTDEKLVELLKKTEETNGTNGNRSQNEKQTLIDLAPLSFSNPELLKRLNDDLFQRTATVVGIIEKKNNRWAAGHLKLFPDKNKEFALFSPNDSRVPRMKIKLTECPPDFYTNSQSYANTLFVAQIVDIPSNSKYAFGELKRSIGTEGNIDVETEAILIENGVDFSEFNEEVIQSLPQTPWSIPEKEFRYRRDFRDYCIFTIDPATARDLDDALHCIQLNDDLYEVGVHIADVSYFVREDSPIDQVACERATSVYLVQRVIPMLPRLLCEQLCSLNPATDRLTFSVVWKINSKGDILEEWFGRSVINSAVKLSYEHAQMFIENPDKQFDISQFPPIRKEFSLQDIKKSVLNMYQISKMLRAKRFKNGCLVLNQVKINYILDKESGLPYGYAVYQQKDSNRLVEEFMLLANIAVAHRIYEKYPQKAILRRHPMPNSKQLMELGDTIKSYGFNCDVSSSSSIQAFLQTIQQENSTSSLTLTCLLTKTMQLAQYFCSGLNLSKEQFYHYGLAVPLYTHFTSPIRRYPDVLVHRLLASSLGYSEETTRASAILQSIAENCNDKKYNARVCSEKSSEIFFSLFINECGPFEEIGCVTQIRDHSFDVLIVNLGIAKRIYCDKLDIIEESVSYVKNESKPEISFVWKPNEKHTEEVKQKLELFSNVNVVLSKHDSDPLKFNITLKHPSEKIISLSSSKIIDELRDKKEETTEEPTLYLQRVDTDPYICD